MNQYSDRKSGGGTYGDELDSIPMQVLNDLRVLSVGPIHCVREHHHEHKYIKGDLR